MKNLTTKQKIKYLLILSAVLLAVLVFVIWLNVRKNRNRTYLTYDVTKSVELEANSSAGYMVLGNGVFRYSRDGASVIGRDGETVWNVSYSMSNPVADVCGKCAAVADKGGKNLYIFDGTGSANPVVTNFPIENISVSGQGVAAVWMNDGSQDYVSLYSKDGKVLVDMNTVIATSGFPVDVSISDDGTKIVTTYVNFVGENIVSQLTFYNFGDVGENYIDGLVGLEKYEGMLLADVEFLNSDVCVAFGEKGFDIFTMEEIPEKVISVEISEKIVHVAYSEKYIGVMTENVGQGERYTYRIYDTKGTVVDERRLDEKYDSFQISGSEVILYSNLQILIYRIHGTVKLSTSLAKNVNKVYSIDNGSAYLLVGDKYAERIKLIGEKTE